MMRYACLIYYDPKKLFGGSPDANAALAECQNHDKILKDGGNFVLGEALEMPENAITIRIRDGKMSSTDGPFMESKEMLGGIVVLDAVDLNDAIRLASTHPIARIGAVEVRPVVDFSQPPPKL